MAKTRLPRPCPMCGEVFTPKFRNRKWDETCSRSCGSKLGAQRRRDRGYKQPIRKGPQVVLVCDICGFSWELPPSQAKGRRTCSIPCAAELKRREHGGTRKGQANPNFKGGDRVGVRDRAAERRWRSAQESKCAVPGCERPTAFFALHHICYRQELRRVGGDEWDPRNGLTLCNSCHLSHHRRGRVLPLSLLPASVFAFALETFGPGPAYEYLRRRYAGEDKRLDALLDTYEKEAA